MNALPEIGKPGDGKTLERMGPSGQAELQLPKRTAIFWFIVIWLLYVFDILDMLAISAVFPAIKAEYHLSDAQLGWLGGVRGLAALIAAIPVGILVDRWSRKYMIAIMSAIWSFFCWATAWMGNYRGLLFTRFMVGAGGAGYNTAGYALIGAWFPPRQRGVMTGLFNTGQPIGAFVGVGLAGWLAVTFGWRSVFGIVAIPGFILAALMLFAPDYKTKKKEKQEELAVGFNFGEAMRYIIKSPSLILLYLAQLGIGMWTFTFSAWVPSFYGRTFNLNMAQAGQAVMFFGLVTIFGAPIGGLLSDWWARRAVNGRVKATLFLTCWCGVFWSLTFTLAIKGYGLVPVLICWSLSQPAWAGMTAAVISSIIDVTAPHFRAFATSFVVLFQNITAFIGPGLAGSISDRMGLTLALFIIMLISIISMVMLFFFATRTYAGDLARLKQLGNFSMDRV
ncbi:putative L-galactonate transporter [Neomoorella glycerini]|uniref:Putative L-galactonate transporter n=1 Tax=Neomoorella glycerini TaxID=55779 RepID=A0A6I5ZNE2_9FIRM|nr:putative L-galactonate transporter [Moorella glycerini]